ncbi:unnamed protein product [Sympodiomycopsis kandeliae]
MLIPFLLFLFIPTLLVTIAFLFLLLYIALYRAPCTTRRTSLGRSAAVIVLGDVGRSPRMCYHVESLADQGWKVAVVGYPGSKLSNSIQQRSSVRLHPLTQLPSWTAKNLPRIAFIALAPFKLLWQTAGLFWKITMVIQPPPEIILVQTPPALPTLFVVRVSSLLLSCRVIIDWHNLAHTILAFRLGQSSPLVTLAKWLERITGRNAYAHLFVTHAMKKHLTQQWNLQGHKAVLHDRPPSHFRRATVSETHRLWKGLTPKLSPSLSDWWPTTEAIDSNTSTPFTSTSTAHSRSAATLRSDRPALAVSSTSWTADEDFSLLLRAAQLYEKRARQVNSGSVAMATPRAKSSSFPSSPSHKRASGVLSSSVSRDQVTGSFISESPRQSGDQAASLPSSWSASSLEPPSQEQPASSPISSPSPSSHHHHHSSAQSADLSPSPSNSSFCSSTPTPHRLRRPSFLFQRSSTLPNYPATTLPKLLIIVTGKGELRSHYEREIARLEKDEDWQWVRIRTAWLENWEYPLLLGSADVGISLHTSSSGLDLPMKVVDMLGCHLPVLALDFPCLGELIQHGRNGLKFSDDEGLEEGMESLLGGFPYAETSEHSGNWLVRAGGLKEPFAYAGQDLCSESQPDGDQDAAESGRFSEDHRRSSSTTRQSLDVFGGAEESEEAKRTAMKRKSFELSKAGLPTSQSFAGVSRDSGYNVASSPTDGRVGENTIGLSTSSSAPSISTSSLPPLRPTTPVPQFTMLASPVLGGGGSFGAFESQTPDKASVSRGANSWSENWKATIRPLIRLADAEDAKAEGVSLSDEEAEEEVARNMLTEADAEEEADEVTALLPLSPSTSSTLSRSFSSASSLSESTNSPQRMTSFKFGSGTNDEDEAPVRRGSKSRRSKFPQSRRRLGSDGRPLKVRGGSVQGLLWAEDFRMSSTSPNNDQFDTPKDGDEDSEEVEEEDGIQLGLFGSVITTSTPKKSSTQRRQFKKGTIYSPPGTPKAKGQKEEGNQLPIPTIASIHSSYESTNKHLRKRTAVQSDLIEERQEVGAGGGGAPAAVPDIWVSAADERRS